MFSQNVVKNTVDSTLNHVVQKGETSYGITKKYNIDINVFYEYNPDAIKGLKKDMVLIIPFMSSNPTDLDTNSTHSVLEGETLWSIAKKYGVNINEIKELNLLENEALQLGQTIKIPNQIVDTNNLIISMVKHPKHPLLNPCDTIIIHKIKKRETLYSLSKSYEVSIDQIMNNNPELEESGLQKGKEIKIIFRIKNCNEDSIVNSISNTIHSTSNNSINKIKVALFLPFLINKFDTVQANCLPIETCPVDKSSIQSIQLYNGVVLALDKLKQKGYKVVLSIYDTQKDSLHTSELLQNPELLNTNLIIGPIFSKQIKLIRSYAKSYDIPMICPSPVPNQALFQYPILYKINPSKSTQVVAIADYLKSKNVSNKRITLLANKKSAKSIKYANLFANSYNDSLSVNDSIKPILLEHTSSFNKVKNISKTDTNIFVIASSDVPFISFVFTKIIGVSNSSNHYKSNFMIFGFDEVLKMNTIDEKYKQLFNLHVSTKGNINFDSEEVMSFVKLYNETFEMQPEINAFIGFDLTLAIFNQLFTNNKSVLHGMYSNIDFEQIDAESGFENKAVKLIKYQDFKLKTVY
ncbi:MAG: LysM peptidoglycan-binding domain-containing protein [Flavobacteriales bacterium]|nr:LysM peptidoglycan-binding domain-containing protein [Flavobacteriales bacterium]